MYYLQFLEMAITHTEHDEHPIPITFDLDLLLLSNPVRLFAHTAGMAEKI